MTIKFKLLFLVLVTLVIATFSILIAVNNQFKNVLDETQYALYNERANTIMGILRGYDERLELTGQREAYKEAFQRAAIEALKSVFSEQETRQINLFVVNKDNKEILHKDLSLEHLAKIRSLVIKKIKIIKLEEKGSFESEKMWFFFKRFPEWNWILVYAIPHEIKYAAVKELTKILIFIMVGITTLSIIVLWIAIIRIFKPIGILTQGAREIAQGNYSLEIEVAGYGELHHLAGDFNLMTKAVNEKVIDLNREIIERERAQKEQEKLQFQLNHAQKMESVGRLAGGVAHDFNNMLGVILGFTELSMETVDLTEPIHSHLNEVLKAATRSKDIVQQLLAFARKQVISPQNINLNKTVPMMLKMLQRIIGEDINLIWVKGDKPWPVHMDPVQIDQILVNLCVNARDAIADVGSITIEINTAIFDEEYCSQNVGFLPGEFVLLIVSDDGCGMHSETIDQVFDPFYTTKDIGKGTGLGLSTIYGIIKQNNGFVRVQSEWGKGSTFNIYLPRHIGESDDIPKEKRAQNNEKGEETILLVEDEPSVLEMTKAMLEILGYTVIVANTPVEAVRMAEVYSGVIDLLMTDVVMPGMNGSDLAHKLLSAFPLLKCLFMSGYTADVIGHHGVLGYDVHFIQKPFSKKELGIKLQEVLSEKKLSE